MFKIIIMITECPGCHRSYDLSAYKAGQRLRCRCGQILMVPKEGWEVHVARTMHCSHCGGGLKKGEPHCQYCGAAVDLTSARLTAYCPSCLSMSKEGARFCSGCGKPLTAKLDHPEEAEESCPHCNIRMRRRDLGAHKTLECPMCCGLFVEVDTFEQLIRQQEQRVGEVAAPGGPEKGDLNAAAVTYIKCPVCSTIMNRLNYARISGVLIDFCREHGYWLDNGELEKIARWVATGGLVKKYELDKEDARAEESRQRSSKAMERVQDSSAVNPYGGVRFGAQTRTTGGLLDLVVSLFDR